MSDEGDLNMLFQNKSLWSKDYFELKATENQRDAGRVLCSPTACLKAGHKFPFEKSTPPCTRERRVTLTEDRELTQR